MVERRQALKTFAVPLPLRLGLLWAATMFCYLYADFFGLFTPGRVMAMNAGILAPFGHATSGIMLGVAAMMIVPSLMVAVPLSLQPAPCRWLNIVFGLAYTGVMIVTLPGAPPFYWLFGLVEIALTLGIVALAWTWPRVAEGDGGVR